MWAFKVITIKNIYYEMKIDKLTASFILLTLLALNPFSALFAFTAPPVGGQGRIYEDPDVASIYMGGSSEMHKFISNTLKYPAEASEKNAQGLVVYTFVVETDGSLSNFELIHRADPQLNEEALRILKSMPPWRPAKHNNKTVRSTNYVPMYFKLNKNAAGRSRSTTASSDIYTKKNEDIINSEVFSIVDKMPAYPYGERELAGFIEKQLRYPKEALQEGVEGRVLCSFIVAADGSISNIEVVQGIHPQLDREASRVLSLMSKWNPGERNGEKVNVKCLLPIDFTIDEEIGS